uniref:Uncharacterized protein n=1 Tax=Caenorhabditis japonica TaxID=281687 RepID=A0A8R1E882_CAEJA
MDTLIAENRKLKDKVNSLEASIADLKSSFGNKKALAEVAAKGISLPESQASIKRATMNATIHESQPELHRSRGATLAAFNNIKNTTDALSCPRIRAQLFESLVLPALTYGSEVWTFTKALSERVRVTHAALERRLVGISLSEQRQRNLHLHKEDIRAHSNVRDPLLVIKKNKLGWAGHIMRRSDGRWTRIMQEWTPRYESDLLEEHE